VRKITKGAEPDSLSKWKQKNKTATYPDLPHEERQSVRAACIAEQFGLCAYCCQSITLDGSHNEHVEAQNRVHNRTLDFTNIVASCGNRPHCGHGRGTQPLRLTPLMVECETELKFYLSGLVAGRTARAEEAIEVLNLGHTEERNRALIGRRRSLVEALIYKVGVQPGELPEIEDKEILDLLLDDLLLPKAHKLEPFSPVLVNIIRQMPT
jgi:uncharacterized protein (TIGR02646 family)